MRVALNIDDKGYRPDFGMFTVLYNGEKVRLCALADDDIGMIIRYRTDDNGMSLLDKNDEPIPELLLGKVELLYKEFRL